MSLHPDHQQYIHLARPQRVDKAIHTLEGIFKGVAIDQKINPAEAIELVSWVDDNRDLLGKHPFTEIMPRVEVLIRGELLEPEEHKDVLWLCSNVSSSSEFFDEVTTDIQVLQGMLHGILADGEITAEEALKLSEWLEVNHHLQGCYPYDELNSLLMSVLKDGKVEAAESKALKDFFEDFIGYSLAKRVSKAREEAKIGIKVRLPGVCASCPDIQFSERVFCFTGSSSRCVRRELAELVIARGATVTDSVSPGLNYLVVGAAGNPCWAFSCYGRKIEEAVHLRREGHRLLIIHEHDFWDAIEDDKN